MPLVKNGNGLSVLSTNDFRAVTRALPVDLLVRTDRYALDVISNLEEVFNKKCFTPPTKTGGKPTGISSTGTSTSAGASASAGTSTSAGASASAGTSTSAGASTAATKTTPPTPPGLDFDTTIQLASFSVIIDKIGTSRFTTGDSFEQVIQVNGQLKLFRQVRGEINDLRLPFNSTKLLERESIQQFLFCYAVYNRGLGDVSGISNFMTNDKDEDGGLKMLYDHVAEVAVKNIFKNEQIAGTPTAPLIGAVRDGNFSFADGSFYRLVKKQIEKFVFSNAELLILDTLNKNHPLSLTETETNLLVDFIKKSKIPVTDANAPFLVLPELQRIRSAGVENFPSGNTVGEGDFFVDYFQEDTATLEINKDNVLCAAQLYFVMTIGDELDVFNVVHRIATRYLTTGAVDIRSRSLLEDLQLYVFSDQFTDLRTGKQHERTRVEERNMFQAQVFGGQYKTKMGEGMVTNTEFAPLWENLMYETAKILQKIEKSENPQFFVSRQNIAQAIEDLQYNLSTYCNGMVKVLAPLANRELDFVMKRFLQNEEIIRQLGPRGSNSVWKVVERVLQEWKGKSVNVVALRNKAIYGHMIVQSIANYTPAMIEDDAEFSKFLNTVEAFIIANSQLEGGSERKEYQDEDAMVLESAPSLNGNHNGKTKDDWDF